LISDKPPEPDLQALFRTLPFGLLFGLELENDLVRECYLDLVAASLQDELIFLQFVSELSQEISYTGEVASFFAL
jgi:hypothetical protein